MERKNYAIAVLAILLVVASVFAVNGNINKIDVNDANKLADKAVADKIVEFNDEFDKKMLMYEGTISDLNSDNAALEVQNAELVNDVADLQAQLDTAVTTTIIATDEGIYFLVEDVPLAGDFGCTIDNDELEFLAYSDVEYNDETIDYEEKLYFSSAFAPVLNVEDFGADILVGMSDEGALSYMLEFDDAVVFTPFADELEIDFLGVPYTLVDYSANELTYRVSEKYDGNYGDTWTIDGLLVKILEVDGDNNKVRIQVGNDIEIIEKGDEKEINGLSIYVEDVFVATIPEDMAWVSLYIGKDITQEVSDSDEFMELDDWEWVIEEDGTGDLISLGVKYVEKLNDDDEYWTIGDGICYPLDFACVEFSEVKNAEVLDLELDIDNDELEVTFDGKIEIDGDRIDDSKFSVDLLSKEYEYYYKNNKEIGTDFDKIVFYQDDREFGFGMSTDVVRVGLNDATGYRFNYVSGEFTASFDGAEKMNDDEDYRMDNADILYQSEVNDVDDKEDTVAVGFVSDEAVEVILRVE